MTQEKLAWAGRLVGRELNGRYRLTRLVGMGGMGAVFAAEHLAVGRRVAVKMLLPDLAADQQTVRRFHQEARSAAAVGRRGVVDILDYDVDPQTGPYLVMEMLDGEPLSRRVARLGKLSAAEVVWIGQSILRTLAAVHAQGIVHRDLKPDNVFIAREEGEEVVKILDFGISRVMATEPAQDSALLTRPGVVLGTPTYMAPEQARAEADVDHRADIYAVGAILFECCAGRPPHVGSNWQQVLAAVLTSPSPPLRPLRPDLPDSMYATIERALARDRAQRFPDAESMLASLTSMSQPLPPTRSPADASSVPQTRIGPATPVGNAWAGSAHGTPYAVSGATEPRRASHAGCLIAGLIGTGLVVATIAVGTGFWLLRSSEVETTRLTGDHETVSVVTPMIVDAGVEAPVDARVAQIAADAGAIEVAIATDDVGGTQRAGRGGRGGRGGSGPSTTTNAGPADPTPADPIPSIDTTPDPLPTGGNVEATLRARLDAANAHRRAGRARQAIDGYEDVIHLAWTAQVPSGTAASRHAAEARMALGDMYSARIRPLPRAPTPEEFSEGWRLVTNQYSQAAQEYGRVGMYGHTDLTVCGLVRTGRASERLADVSKNVLAPQTIADLGQQQAEQFESGFRDTARSYLESARGVYEAAMNIPSTSPCRTEAMDSMQRVLRALGRRNP